MIVLLPLPHEGDMLALLAESALQGELSSADIPPGERSVLCMQDTSFSPSVQQELPDWTVVLAQPVSLEVLESQLEILAQPAFPLSEVF